MTEMEPLEVGAVPPRTTRAPCQVHANHTPQSHINEVHHVWPLGDGGPNIPANKVTVCATGHNNIHDLLNKYRQAAGDPGWETLRHYTRQERVYAALGWQRILWQAMEQPA
jgi:hypothetical protein